MTVQVSVRASSSTEGALVDVAVQGARVRSTAEATELAAIAQLVFSRQAAAREELLEWRREHPDTRGAHRPWDVALAENEEMVTAEVADEIAAALHLSSRTARARVDLAVDLLTIAPRTWAALRDAVIDVARARRIVEALAPVQARDHDAAGRVEAQLLARAGDRTPAQVAALARRLVLKAFPDAGREARARAHADRRCGVDHGNDPSGRDAGQASFWVTGRADQVQAAFDTVTRAAEAFQAEHPDDPRTLDQVHADLALTALLGEIRTGEGWTRAPDPPVTAHLVLPLSALQGGSDPAELLGHGPIPADLARDLLTDPDTGHLRDDVTFTQWLVNGDGVVTATGSRTYRPTAAVDRTVRARDATCRFPAAAPARTAPRTAAAPTSITSRRGRSATPNRATSPCSVGATTTSRPAAPGPLSSTATPGSSPGPHRRATGTPRTPRSGPRGRDCEGWQVTRRGRCWVRTNVG